MRISVSGVEHMMLSWQSRPCFCPLEPIQKWALDLACSIKANLKKVCENKKILAFPHWAWIWNSVILELLSHLVTIREDTGTLGETILNLWMNTGAMSGGPVTGEHPWYVWMFFFHATKQSTTFNPDTTNLVRASDPTEKGLSPTKLLQFSCHFQVRAVTCVSD